MALINSSDKYIKVIKDGSYYIYPSQEARNREKNATPAQTIINEYESRLQDLEADEERMYYDTEVWAAEHDPLAEEYNRYTYDLKFYIQGHSYPVMAQTYPDIADSIPEIIESGQIVVAQSETEAEEYELVKEEGFFGETEDA